MNILAFNYEYPPIGGGGGVVFRAIFRKLAETHSVTVVTTHFRGLPECERDGNLVIHRVPVLGRRDDRTATFRSLFSYFPASLRRGRALAKEHKYDIVNSHFVVPSSPSADIIARQLGVPHIISVHGGDLFDPTKRLSPHRLPLVRGTITKLLSGADRVVAQSRNTAENARTYFNVNRAIDIIPLGIPETPIPPRDRDALDIGEDRFVMVTIGRLIPRKGLEDLIDLVESTNDPNDLLVIVGDGPLRESLAETVKKRGLRDRVRLTGYVTDEEKAAYLAASDLYVSTTRHEGFGLVYLEAMHFGLPVISYDFGGQADFLEEGKTGSLIPLGRKEMFLEAIRKYKGDPALLHECGGFNRRHVRDYYIDRCAERYEKIFQEERRKRT